MKKIILFLAVILLISCKKETDKSISNKIQNTQNSEIGFISYGDLLISKSDFVSQIQNNNDIKLQRANLSKIKFDYDKFTTWDYNTTEEKNIGTITLKLKKEKKKNPDATLFTHINLSIYKNDKKIDELTVYKEENYSEALVAINQYFYIDSDLNLWTLETNEDEDGIKVIFWNYYKIDKGSGKINLIKHHIFNNSQTPDVNKNNNSWIGKYSFEKSNRDDLKTSFEIVINNLNNITVVYISDGEKPETYKNIVGEIVADDKIKIVFNKKYDDMGIIYIQNYGKEYIISGEPISTINPGNEEFPLRKIK
ncbi:hypothetical protein DOS84_09765 [Flavobacterium aquariorum]|uniref:Lipoprotein n=1 Tax=Flavobacterium aquariorum TaxID=2217670 RepID=A0A2W7UJX2_9FLAO|nr:hypothetical protein [Flavobacterium aquariorum]PZX93685.1 hypothetical protein DOS84_09765 [Flavobacterium aquariorum]